MSATVNLPKDEVVMVVDSSDHLEKPSVAAVSAYGEALVENGNDSSGDGNSTDEYQGQIILEAVVEGSTQGMDSSNSQEDDSTFCWEPGPKGYYEMEVCGNDVVDDIVIDSIESVSEEVVIKNRFLVSVNLISCSVPNLAGKNTIAWLDDGSAMISPHHDTPGSTTPHINTGISLSEIFLKFRGRIILAVLTSVYEYSLSSKTIKKMVVLAIRSCDPGIINMSGSFTHIFEFYSLGDLELLNSEEFSSLLVLLRFTFVNVEDVKLTYTQGMHTSFDKHTTPMVLGNHIISDMCIELQTEFRWFQYKRMVQFNQWHKVTFTSFFSMDDCVLVSFERPPPEYDKVSKVTGCSLWVGFQVHLLTVRRFWVFFSVYHSFKITALLYGQTGDVRAFVSLFKAYVVSL